MTTACLAALAAPAAALAQAEEIVPGASYELLEPDDLPARIHLVTLDLTATELSFDATPAEERGQTTSAFAAAAGAAIAINGGPFSPIDFSPYGIAIGAGAEWPDSDASAQTGSLALDRAGPRTEAAIAGGTTGIDAAVAGGPVLVEAGQPREDFDCDDRLVMACEPAPRTAAALAEDGTRLLLAVVDGWQEGSAGATAAELAAMLADRGADEAILLDGGSASTLFAEPLGGVVSTPSDGAERRVANHLAVFFDELAPGEMTVLVRERDVDDPDADFAGATVTLDDGREATTNADGEARFADVRPRLACATARAEGYEPTTACRQVPPGAAVLNAIAIFPEGEAPDAPAAPQSGNASPDPAAAGCHAAPGRLHRGGFHVTLGALLAVALFAAAARRREPSVRPPYRR